MGKAALIVVAILLTSASPRQEPTKEDAAAPAQKLAELQKARIDVLRSAAEVSVHLAQQARIEVSEAMEDRIALLEAELDAAATEQERTALYAQTMDSLRTLEELAQARKAAARGTELDVLRIKARLLKVEIQLERAKTKGPK